MYSIQTQRKARAKSVIEKRTTRSVSGSNMADVSVATGRTSRSKSTSRTAPQSKQTSAKSLQSLTDTLKEITLSKSISDMKPISEVMKPDSEVKLDIEAPSTKDHSDKHSNSMSKMVGQAKTNLLQPPSGDSLVILEPNNCDIATLVQAINTMQNTIRDSHVQLSTTIETKFDSLKEKIDYLHDRFDRQDQSLQTMAAGMIDRSELLKIESTINTVAAQADQNFEDIHRDLFEMRSAVEFLRTDNLRLKQKVAALDEKQNLAEIKDRRFSLTIEGILEVKDKDTKTLLIDKLNNEAEADLTTEELISVKRLGKVTKYKKNRTISVVVRDENARNKVLKTRGKLKVEVANTSIWINEELPASYRRRKSMLRDLVMLAISKKHKAKIDKGGINLDGKLYLPHEFHKLPGGLQPHDACSRNTENGGLAFATEWSPLSNLFQADFRYEDMWFVSADQCYNYQRALFEDQDDIAETLLVTTDPSQCQKLGESFPESDEWIAKREEIMTEIIGAKFDQNDICMKILKDTEDATLYDASYDHFWGINLSLHAKDTIEEKGKGQNKLGCILLALRDGLIEGQSTHSDQQSATSDINPSSIHSAEDLSVQTRGEDTDPSP